MKAFARLYAALEDTTSTLEKVDAMVQYFRVAAPEDAAWAIYFLNGNKPRQVVPSRKLVAWATESAAIPGWLFDESHDAVGDLAETITLLVPGAESAHPAPLSYWVEQRLLPLRDLAETEQREGLLAAWRELDAQQRLVWNKLITGSFRVGVAKSLVIRALSEFSGVPQTVISHRLMGPWAPDGSAFTRLIGPEDAQETQHSQPYPFFLCYALESEPAALGPFEQWHAEWKWDGIRAQLVRRENQTFLWSRGEDLVTERFPEIAGAAERLPDGTVIDGEILPWSGDRVLPFSQLQRRIGRKKLSAKMLAEIPVVLLAYDLLEIDGTDIRARPFAERRALLENLLARYYPQGPVILSPAVTADDWEALAALRVESRERYVEGFVLKDRTSPYGTGRRRGGWWKWKIDPFSVDAVLIYAQSGHGRRASLYTDYTFGVWNEGELVPFAKAYSGLTDAEIREVDRYIRRNTLEKFGPVRVVKPELVFELAFEAIQRSSRHRSGIAVRFPRIARWRQDKPASEADTLQNVTAMIPS